MLTASSGTRKVYLQDASLTTITATVLSVSDATVVLDKTIFEPLVDTGIISGNFATFYVDESSENAEQIVHKGRFSGNPFTVGELVTVSVDLKRRMGKDINVNGMHAVPAC